MDCGTGLPDITSGAFTISGWFNFDSVSATHWLWGRGTGSGSGSFGQLKSADPEAIAFAWQRRLNSYLKSGDIV